MTYYAYVAVQEKVGAVALYRADCTEVWHRKFDIKQDTATKYNVWFDGCNVLINCLRDSTMHGDIKADDIVHINLPVYVLYKWLTGAKPPIKYMLQKDKLVAGLQRVPCTLEVTPMFGTPNRALQFCNEETYTDVLTAFAENNT